jgi:Alpha-2-macroglobulin family
MKSSKSFYIEQVFKNPNQVNIVLMNEALGTQNKQESLICKRFDKDRMERSNQENPQPWLTEKKGIDASGKLKFDTKLLKTEGTYIISGFSSNPDFGTVRLQPRKLRIVNPITVNLSCPKQVLVDDIVEINVTLKNHMRSPINVEVMLINDKEYFEFVYVAPKSKGYRAEISQIDKTLTTSTFIENNVKSVFLKIRASRVGDFAFDVIVRGKIKNKEYILAKQTTEVNVKDTKSTLLHQKIFDLREQRFSNFYIFAKNDILRAKISVVGDVLGKPWESVEKLW